MIERIIRASFAKPVLAVALVLAGSALGLIAFRALPRDVFPDLSAPVFNVIVQNAAMGAEELETAIAIPMETALAGLPNVRRIRSNSQLGVSQITIEFEPDADYYRSRQFVAERVSQATARAAARNRCAPRFESDRPAERDLRVHARGRTGRGGPDDPPRPGRVRG